MIKIYLVLLIYLSLQLTLTAHSKLPQEYKLLLEYRETKDLNKRIKIGKKLINEFPSAVFIDDLKIMVVKDLLKKGRKKEAKNIFSTVNIKRIRFDLIEDFAEISRKLNYVDKYFVVQFPEHFTDFLDRFEFSENEVLKISRKLYFSRKYKEAKDLIDKYIKRYKKLCYIEAQIFYRMKNYEKALEMLKNCPHKDSEKLITRIFLRNEEYDKALSYIALHSKNKSDLYLFAGKYVFRDGFPTLSKAFFEKAKDGYEKFFFLGLVNFAEKNYKEAAEYFKKAVKSSSNRKELSRASFWVYKSLTEMDNPEENPSSYLVLSSIGDGFYSATSKIYLGQNVANINALKANVEIGNSPIVDTLRAIKNAGFLHYMRLEAIKRSSSFTKSDILSLSKEDPYLALKLAARKWGVSSDIYKAVSYVHPYKDIVLKVSQKYSVDPQLVYAIMRQESLFDQYAISRSGAKGLMQLMDRTARWMAKKYRIRLKNIFDVKTNIELGVAYLSYLHKVWDNDLVRIIASYNAGENAVKRWRQYSDIYLFIESIPYNETRNYVKKVLYNFYIYSERDLN